MLDKKENLKGTTAVGVAIFPKLSKPDFKFKSEHGEYSLKLRLEGDAAAALKAKIDAFHAKAFEAESRSGKFYSESKEGSHQKGDPAFGEYTKPYKKAQDEDGNFLEGVYEFKFSMSAGGVSVDKAGNKEAWSRKCTIVDAQLNPTSCDIWGGSEVAISYGTRVWCSGGSGFGISLSPIGVQVIKLVSRGEQTGESLGFGAVDGGFVADDNDNSPPEENEGEAQGDSDSKAEEPEF